MRSKFWILAAACQIWVMLLPGCRDIASESSSQGKCGLSGVCPAAIPSRPPADLFGAGDPRGNVSVIMEEVIRGPVKDYVITIQPEDTLNLLAEWSGQTVNALLNRNPEVRSNGLVAGSGFVIGFSEGAYKKFNGARNGYRAGLLEKKARGVEIARFIQHVVKPGDTIESIVAGYKTTVDLVERFNPDARGLALYVGDIIKVPILVDTSAPNARTKDEARENARPSARTDRRKTERLPGPAAPGPSPVPVPPSRDSRRLLVDSPADFD